MNNLNISSFNSNTLELHYEFNDNSHTMDAYVHNKCETELLNIIKELVSIFEVELIIETEPLAEGGSISRYIIKGISGINSTHILSAAVTSLAITAVEITIADYFANIVTNLLITIITTPISTIIGEPIKKVIDKYLEDPCLRAIEREKGQLEIENLKLDIALKSQKLSKNHSLVKKRSNYYETLNKYEKVTQVSLKIEDDKKNQLSDEIIVKRESFHKFILMTDTLDPIEIDNAIIEIISPVLKKGDYKWRGIYNGETVLFTMKSNEFKTLVQTGKIEFKNGSSINCLLQIEKRLNSDWLEQIISHNILRVNNYFENDKPVETPEGKRHRQKIENDKAQLKIGFENKEDF